MEGWNIEEVSALSEEEQRKYLIKLYDERQEKIDELKQAIKENDKDVCIALCLSLGKILTAVAAIIGVGATIVLPRAEAGPFAIMGVIGLFSNLLTRAKWYDHGGIFSDKNLDKIVASQEAKEQIKEIKKEIKPFQEKVELLRGIDKAKNDIQKQEKLAEERKELSKLNEELAELKKQVVPGVKKGR